MVAPVVISGKTTGGRLVAEAGADWRRQQAGPIQRCGAGAVMGSHRSALSDGRNGAKATAGKQTPSVYFWGNMSPPVCTGQKCRS